MVFCYGSLNWLIHEIFNFKIALNCQVRESPFGMLCWFLLLVNRRVRNTLSIPITYTHTHTQSTQSSHTLLRQGFPWGKYKLIEKAVPRSSGEKKTCQGRVLQPWTLGPGPCQCSSYPKETDTEAEQGSRYTQGGHARAKCGRVGDKTQFHLPCSVTIQRRSSKLRRTWSCLCDEKSNTNESQTIRNQENRPTHIIADVLQSPEQMRLSDHAIRCQKKGMVNSI